MRKRIFSHLDLGYWCSLYKKPTVLVFLVCCGCRGAETVPNKLTWTQMVLVWWHFYVFWRKTGLVRVEEFCNGREWEGSQQRFSSLVGKQRLVAHCHCRTVLVKNTFWMTTVLFLMKSVTVKTMKSGNVEVLFYLMNWDLIIFILACKMTFLMFPFLQKSFIFDILPKNQSRKPYNSLTA